MPKVVNNRQKFIDTCADIRGAIYATYEGIVDPNGAMRYASYAVDHLEEEAVWKTAVMGAVAKKLGIERTPQALLRFIAS